MLNLLESGHQRKLLKRWAPILESGEKITSENTKTVLAQVLENTRAYYASKGMLMEAGPKGVKQADRVGTYAAGNGVMNGDYRSPYTGGDRGDYYLPNVVMPILRRIFPQLIANELVGVQPPNGPIGFAMAYRPTLNTNGQFGRDKDGTGNEIGYSPTDTRWTGLSADDTIAGADFPALPEEDANGEYWKAYAGNDKGAWRGVGAPLGEESEYAEMGESYPTVTFGLIKTGVEAKTRKLGAHWSPELAEDMQAMHGIDVEKEMINILSYEIGAEIDRQIITEMVKAAITGGSTTKWSPKTADGLDQMGRLATLLTQVAIEAQQIAIRTRRGNANFAVTSPKVTALLQQLSMQKYTSFKNANGIPSVPDTGVGALTKVGLINDDNMLLVRDSYAASDYILMGYKGSHPGDSGIIYCPYIPIQLAKVLQPGSFTPSVGARTRYGVMSNPWDARNYYAFMKVDLAAGWGEGYAWGDKRFFIAEPSPIKPKGLPGQPDTVFPQA